MLLKSRSVRKVANLARKRPPNTEALALDALPKAAAMRDGW